MRNRMMFHKAMITIRSPINRNHSLAVISTENGCCAHVLNLSHMIALPQLAERETQSPCRNRISRSVALAGKPSQLYFLYSCYQLAASDDAPATELITASISHPTSTLAGAFTTDGLITNCILPNAVVLIGDMRVSTQ